MIRVKGMVALTAVVALVGCKPVEEAINNAFYKGTLAGAEKCMELKSSTLVSADNVKNSCVAEFEEPVPVNIARSIVGRGAPETRWNRKVFSATLENPSADYVITEVRIEVRTLNPDQTVDGYYFSTMRVWIEPGQKNFQLITDEVPMAPDNWDKIDDCDSCWSWNIDSVKGLKM